MKITKKSFQAFFTRASFAGLLLVAGATGAQAQTNSAVTEDNALRGSTFERIFSWTGPVQKSSASIGTWSPNSAPVAPSNHSPSARATFPAWMLNPAGVSPQAAATVTTSGTLTPTAATYNFSTAPWAISTGDGTYPDLGGTATFNSGIGATAGTLFAGTAVTVDVSPTLSQINYNSPFSTTLAAGTSTSIIAATTGLTLNATQSPINTPTLFLLANTISSPISGGGTVGLTKTGSGTVALSGTNTYTGGTHINGGLLEVTGGGDAVFGDASGGISFNGGALFTSNTLTSARNIFIDTGGATIYTSTATTLSGVISGSGSLTNAGFGAVALTLTGANTYTGATIGRQNVSSFVLSGNGSINQSSSYDFGGSVTLTNTGTNVLDRLSDTAALTVRGINFISTGNATATSSETIGAVTAASGYTSFLVTPGTTAANSLTMASLTRQNNATFAFRGTGLGGTPGNTVANIYATTAPTLTGGGGGAGTTTISILPYAYANSTTSVLFTAAGLINSSLVTYDTNGFRPLATAEYATAFGGNATDNVRINAATAVPNTGLTANAVLLAPATAAASALSGGPINITSGAFLYSPTANVTGTVSVGMNFGTAEGIITNTSLLNLSSVITGSGGVTFTTAYAPTSVTTATLVPTGASTYTGNTTINGANVNITGTTAAAGSASIFGNSGTVVLASGTNLAGLVGTAATTFNRDISSIGTGANYLTASGSGYTMTFNGNVSLTNNIYLYANANAAASAFTFNGTISGTGEIIDTGLSYVVLNGANTYSGGTAVGSSTYASTFLAGTDTAFGTGPIYFQASGTGGSATLAGVGTTPRTIANSLVTGATTNGFGGAAPLTFTGGVNLNGARTLSFTDSALVTFSGNVSNGAVSKTGTGAAAFNSTTGNTYTGGTVVSAGSLLVNNTSGSGTGTGAVSIASGTALGGAFTLAGTTSLAGTLSPGNSGLTVATVGQGVTGTANFGSALTMASTASLYLEASSNVNLDRLNVGGVFTLAGTVNLVTINGYIVQAGTTLDFIDFGSITAGTFTLNTAGLTLAPGTALDTSRFAIDGSVTVNAVPEPGTWAAIVGGLGVLGSVQFARRRRSRRA